MTLLTIVTNVLDEIGFAAPTTVIGSSDRTAIQALALANRGGKQLAKRGKGIGGWSILQTEHTFTTTDGTAEYALPSDFDFLIDDTLWDRTNFWKLWGPVSPQEWQRIKSGVLASSAGPRRRVRIQKSASSNVKAVFVDPTPSTTGDTLVFEHVSDLWCQSSGGTGQSAWIADDDTGILDEYLLEMDLKWRFAKGKGLEWGQDHKDFELELSQALARDGGSQILNMGDSSELLLTANIQDADFPSS